MIPLVIYVVSFPVPYQVHTDSFILSREAAVEDVGDEEVKEDSKQ